MFEVTLLFIAGIISGVIAAAAGGGGAIVSFAALIFFGMPTQLAIGTYKMGLVGLFPLSLVNYCRSGKLILKLAFQLFLIAIIGNTIGSLIAISLDATLVNVIVSCFLVLLLFFLWFNKRVGIESRESHPLWPVAYFLNTIYAGFLAMASGIFSVTILSSLRGLRFIEANGTNLLAQTIPMLLSFIIFFSSGFVDIQRGLILFIGSLIGGWIGSKLALKKGEEWVKKFIMVVILGTIIKLLLF